MSDSPSFKEDPKGYILKQAPAKALGFLSTFASMALALMLQNCQAEQGFKGEYLDQLEAFKEELKSNAALKESYAEIYGPMGNPPIGGALEAYAKELEESVGEAEGLNFCAAMYSEVISNLPEAAQNHALMARLSDADRGWLTERLEVLAKCKEACGKLKADEWRFRSISIELGVRQESWMAMQRNSSRTFPNRDLAVDLGKLYGRLGRILGETDDIERDLNNTFAKSMNNLQQAKLSLAFVLDEHLDDIDTNVDPGAPKAEKPHGPPPTAAQLDERFEHYTSLRSNMNIHSGDAFGVWSDISLKVARIKDLSNEMDRMYAETQSFIDQEITETKKGYHPWMTSAHTDRPKKQGAEEKKSAVKKAPEAPKKPGAKTAK